MASWQRRTRGNKLGYQVFVWVLKNFGVFPAYIMLIPVSFYFFLFSGKSSKHIYFLYRYKLGFGRWASLFKIYKNYYSFGQSIIDKVVIMSGIKNKFTYNFEGEENLREIVALNKGGMLLSAHIGNWDIAGQLLKRVETRVNIVMFDGEQQQIKDYLEAISEKKSINIIFIKDDLSHIYQISEAFKNNELVCIHADRFIKDNKTISTGFLGRQARFPMGPFVLASMFKVPVSYVFAIKESSLHYHFFASKIIDYGLLEKKQLMQQMVTGFAAEMEIKVKKYPEQWYNYYNFWG